MCVKERERERERIQVARRKIVVRTQGNMAEQGQAFKCSNDDDMKDLSQFVTLWNWENNIRLHIILPYLSRDQTITHHLSKSKANQLDNYRLCRNNIIILCMD